MSRCDLDPAPQIINKETCEFPGPGSRNHEKNHFKIPENFEVNVPTFFSPVLYGVSQNVVSKVATQKPITDPPTEMFSGEKSQNPPC